MATSAVGKKQSNFRGAHGVRRNPPNVHFKLPHMRRIFYSGQGLRWGWSLTLFILVYTPLTLGTQYGFATIPVLRHWAAAQPHGIITPISQIEFTGLELLILLLSIGVVRLFDTNATRSYGLPASRETLPWLLKGIGFGLGLATLLFGLIAACRGFSITDVALHGRAIVADAVLYGLGFFLVGCFEELVFRGYLQATLQRGIGFWPAAAILSLAFGAVHLPGLKHAWGAAVVAPVFGLWAAYALRRTRNLWFLIGTHAAFDWGVAFFYSSPLAGQPVQDRLLDISLRGPTWLTGGPAGVVGSSLMFGVLAIAGVVVHYLFPPSSPRAEHPNTGLCPPKRTVDVAR